MHKIYWNLLKYVFSLGLSGVLLWLAFRNISFSEVIHSFQEANYFWIGVSFCFAIISHWARAVRWNLLLKPLGYEISPFRSFLAVMVGYFMNFIIPRAGEVVRCGTIQRLEKVPADTAFGTVVLERIIDVLMLGGMIVLLLLVEINRLSSFFVQFLGNKFASIQSLLTVLIVLGVVGLLLLGLLIKYWKVLQRFALIARLNAILLNILAGLSSIRKVQNLPLFVFYTFLIWLMYYAMAYVLFFCFERTAHLDMWFGFIVLVMGAIGMATPVQGGFGAYHFLVGSVFGLRGLTAEDGIVLATFMHTFQTIIMLLIGGLSVAISLVLERKEKKTSVEE